MSYYRKCPDCGANLDPGEKCDCVFKKSSFLNAEDVKIPHGEDNALKGFTLGRMGRGRKSIRFPIEEFKAHLAPEGAKIERYCIDGKEYIRMSY